MKEQMTKRERVMATLSGKAVDRPPYGFWRHFFEAEHTLEAHVASILWWQDRVQNDFLKVQPRASFMVEDWGAVYEYRDAGRRVGGRRGAQPSAEDLATDRWVPWNATAGRSHASPQRLDYPIKVTAHWGQLNVLSCRQGALGDRLRALRAIGKSLEGEVPFVETLFSPLSIACRMAESEERLKRDMRENPELLHQALAVIAETFAAFAKACLEVGCSGIFFATTSWASYDLLTDAEYAVFGRPYDLKVLETVREAELNILHVCGQSNMLYSLADYPVHAFNWSATDATNPSLREAKARLPGALIGGISGEALSSPNDDAVLAQLRDAREQTGGIRWMVGPNCSIPVEMRYERLDALRSAITQI